MYSTRSINIKKTIQINLVLVQDYYKWNIPQCALKNRIILENDQWRLLTNTYEAHVLFVPLVNTILLPIVLCLEHLRTKKTSFLSGQKI